MPKACQSWQTPPCPKVATAIVYAEKPIGDGLCIPSINYVCADHEAMVCEVRETAGCNWFVETLTEEA